VNAEAGGYVLDKNLIDQNKRDRALLKARSDSLLNLKVIVLTMWFTTLFNLIYSIMVKTMYNP